MSIRLISFAGTTLSIEYDGLTAARIVELLYQHVSTDYVSPVRVTYRLCSDDTSARVQLYRDETLLYDGHCAGSVAELLLGDSCYQLAAHCHTGLLFHAAALSGRGRTLILPGTSGAGKSTLTAWLISQGFDYLSDELVFVPWQTNTIQAFTRPLSLKKPARLVLSRCFDYEAQADSLLSSNYVDLVPPTLLSSNRREGVTRKAGNNPIIIFPQYQNRTHFEWQPLSPARAGLALMTHLINARNLPDHGFGEIARIAGCIPAYNLSYSGFDHLTDKFELVIAV
ncbi:MAG: hypothetical protein KDI62_04930 [Anaerolineae bacterium]|nr:hypothetical protein [Anaerolineae bacterium]